MEMGNFKDNFFHMRLYLPILFYYLNNWEANIAKFSIVKAG